LQEKVQREHNVDIEQLERNLFQAVSTPRANGHEQSGRRCNEDDGIDGEHLGDESSAWQGDEGFGADDEGASGTVDEDDGDENEDEHEDSGFGLVEGVPARFTTTKFWNYVDHLLAVMRKTAKKSATPAEYETRLQGCVSHGWRCYMD